MEDLGAAKKTEVMTLGKGFLIYIGMMVFIYAVARATNYVDWVSGWIIFPVYIFSGFLLNRLVLSSIVEWHPIYNTLENVSSTKLRAFAFWPIFYPSLFFKILVVRSL